MSITRTRQWLFGEYLWPMAKSYGELGKDDIPSWTSTLALKSPTLGSEVRLDQLLVARGLVRSRQQGIDLIRAGHVEVAGVPVRKGGQKVSRDCELRLVDIDRTWVSRGAAKLVKALDVWNIAPDGWICMDVGASTGGFTEVLLDRGAEKVYAIDVGVGQLAERLCKDSRVVNLEKVNARSVLSTLIDVPIDFVCLDVSFISLNLVLPNIVGFLAATGRVVALVKPQFEVGPEGVGKGGIVRHQGAREKAVDRISRLFVHLGLSDIGVVEAPRQQINKNVEYLLYGQRKEAFAADVWPTENR